MLVEEEIWNLNVGSSWYLIVWCVAAPSCDAVLIGLLLGEVAAHYVRVANLQALGKDRGVSPEANT